MEKKDYVFSAIDSKMEYHIAMLNNMKENQLKFFDNHKDVIVDNWTDDEHDKIMDALSESVLMSLKCTEYPILVSRVKKIIKEGEECLFKVKNGKWWNRWFYKLIFRKIAKQTAYAYATLYMLENEFYSLQIKLDEVFVICENIKKRVDENKENE